ncbi:HD domain-containing protein [Candidatus Pacearchaeota archaeon]|nr:HD domain-containing protein [Candidatus Pacearchaeota archaeon]
MESDLIIRAKEFAIKKHKGQTRKDGSPYVNHPIRVADIVSKFKKSHKIDDLVAAAYLHDTLEETDTGVYELSENFGYLVALLVVELTTDKFSCSKVGKTAYLAHKLSSENALGNWALVIKLADRLDNVSDLITMDIKFAKKYKKETEEILKVVEEKRELTEVHKKLIKVIREKLEEVVL